MLDRNQIVKELEAACKKLGLLNINVVIEVQRPTCSFLLLAGKAEALQKPVECRGIVNILLSAVGEGPILIQPEVIW
jgi:hypothetical protein